MSKSRDLDNMVLAAKKRLQSNNYKKLHAELNAKRTAELQQLAVERKAREEQQALIRSMLTHNSYSEDRNYGLYTDAEDDRITFNLGNGCRWVMKRSRG